MSLGQLYTVVGPSGAGKDTVLDQALLRCPTVVRLRRCITRAAEAGGEDIDAVNAAEFSALSDQGAFALSWQAHGISYGIPRKLDDLLVAGQRVVFNGSRGALPDITGKYPQVHVISIIVNPAVLSQRLTGRGRETAPEIQARLQRASLPITTQAKVIEIDNSGPVERAVQQMVALFNS